MNANGSDRFASYARFVVRHRWTVLLSRSSSPPASSAGAATRLRVEVDPDALLPQAASVHARR